MPLKRMLADIDVLQGNTIYCSVSQRCQLVAGKELEISVSKTYSPTQIALDEFQILRTPLTLSYEAY
jgi:hypothetical protein